MVHIIAEDMQRHGTAGKDLGPFAPTEQPAIGGARAEGRGAGGGGRGAAGNAAGGGRAAARGRGRGRGMLTATLATADAPAAVAVAVPVTGAVDAAVLQATRAGVEHVPSEMERAADSADLQIIRDLYGSRSQTIINALLLFDAYFNWWFPYEDRALENMQTATDMYEMYERVSINSHKSFLPHGAVYKTTKDILEVKDVHKYNLSSLELQNAETKRTAEQCGSRRLETSSVGATVVKGGKLIDTKGYSSSMAVSTLNHLLVTKYLRKGDGIIATPASRRAERLFGVTGTGRSSARRAGAKSVEKLMGHDYDPRGDTCIKAFVRHLADAATTEVADDTQ
jgi:hypothetical protein